MLKKILPKPKMGIVKPTLNISPAKPTLVKPTSSTLVTKLKSATAAQQYALKNQAITKKKDLAMQQKLYAAKAKKIKIKY